MESNQPNLIRLKVCALGLAFGITWSLGVFLLGILAWLCGIGGEMQHMLGTLYLGYDATLLGSLIGAAWALVDGFVCGVIVAWLYNLFAHCCTTRSL